MVLLKVVHTLLNAAKVLHSGFMETEWHEWVPVYLNYTYKSPCRLLSLYKCWVKKTHTTGFLFKVFDLRFSAAISSCFQQFCPFRYQNIQRVQMNAIPFGSCNFYTALNILTFIGFIEINEDFNMFANFNFLLLLCWFYHLATILLGLGFLLFW